MFLIVLAAAFQADLLGNYRELDIPLPAIGFIKDGRVFVFRNKKNAGQFLQVRDPEEKTVREYNIAGFLGGIPGWPRFTIEGGSYWFGGGPNPARMLRVPFDDLVLYDLRDRDAYFERWKKRYPKSGFEGREPLTHEWRHEIIADIVFSAGGFPPPFPPVPASQKLFCADYVPVGTREVRLFLLFANKRMKTYRQEGIWDAAEERWFMGRETTGTGSIACPFLEPFYAFATISEDVRGFPYNTTYYFLTQSSKLYIIQPPPEGESYTIELIWADKNRKITAVITDVGRKKTYLFGHDLKANMLKRDFYFELAPIPNSHYYADGDLNYSAAKNTDGWMRTIVTLSSLLPGARRTP